MCIHQNISKFNKIVHKLVIEKQFTFAGKIFSQV